MRIPRLEAETRGTDHGIIGALFEMVKAAPKVAPGPPFLLRCIADPTQTESRSPARSSGRRRKVYPGFTERRIDCALSVE
jgi:hypothetical protein